ncbi:hypothetical protein EV714DRAFT_219134 [Schizophyllum commune]
MFCFYAPEEAQFEFGSGGDTSPELNRDSYLYPVNVAIQEGRRKAGLIVDLDRQLPPLLAEAGLRVVAEDKGTIPVGKMVGEMLGGGAAKGAKEGEGEEGGEGKKEGEGEKESEGEKEHLDVPRHVPYSVKSFGPPSPSVLKTGFDFGEKGESKSCVAYFDCARRRHTSTTLASHPHIHPPLPLSPPLSATDLRTIEGATAKMFGHFVGMMRGAWEEGCLRDYDGQVLGKGGEREDLEKESEGEKRLEEIEARVWKEFEAKGCHYGVREWVLEVV